MSKTKKPRLTEKVLDGLAAALARAEADLEAVYPDNKEEYARVVHADRWLRAMYRYRESKKESRDG